MCARCERDSRRSNTRMCTATAGAETSSAADGAPSRPPSSDSSAAWMTAREPPPFRWLAARRLLFLHFQLQMAHTGFGVRVGIVPHLAGGEEFQGLLEAIG